MGLVLIAMSIRVVVRIFFVCMMYMYHVKGEVGEGAMSLGGENSD